jgi:hypothetical protein
MEELCQEKNLGWGTKVRCFLVLFHLLHDVHRQVEKVGNPDFFFWVSYAEQPISKLADKVAKHEQPAIIHPFGHFSGNGKR